MSKQKRIRWTEENDAILLKCIADDTSISKGCIKAAKKLNRSVTACQSRYFKHLQKTNKVPSIIASTPAPKRTRHIWSKEEIKFLEDTVKKCDTLNEAFKIVSQKLDISTLGVRDKWYQLGHKLKQPSSKWTPEEDRVLIHQLELHPECFQEAFVVASRLTGRSLESCAKRWYNKLSIDPKVKAYAFMGNGLVVRNRRYPSRPCLTEKRSISFWSKIKEFIWPSKQ
jgi:hypothetical protein